MRELFIGIVLGVVILFLLLGIDLRDNLTHSINKKQETLSRIN